MQRLPFKGGEGRLALRSEPAGLGLEVRTVDGIAQQG